MVNEPQDCLDYLQANIPKWSKDLDIISNKVAKWQGFERNGGIESRADEHVNSPEQSMKSAAPNLKLIRVTEKTNDNKRLSCTHIVRLTMPSRRTSSLWSGFGGASWSFRRRKICDLYYNAEAQRLLYAMVRTITIGRGILHKAITQRSECPGELVVTRITDASSTSRSESSADHSDAGASTTTLSSEPESLGQCLEEMEMHLEQSQVLCEKAAYHLLREGECSNELDEIKHQFERTLELVSKQRTKAIPRTTPQLRVGESRAGTLEASEPIVRVQLAAEASPISVALEVDDEDEEEVEPLDVRSQFRSITSSRATRQ